MSDQLPEDIAKAIEAFDDAAQSWGWEADQGTGSYVAASLRAHKNARAALEAAILKRLGEVKKLQKSVAALNAERLWTDDNHPWRIVLYRDGQHSAVAEQYEAAVMGDGEWSDGDAICEIVNAAIRLCASVSATDLGRSALAEEGGGR